MNNSGELLRQRTIAALTGLAFVAGASACTYVTNKPAEIVSDSATPSETPSDVPASLLPTAMATSGAVMPSPSEIVPASSIAAAPTETTVAAPAVTAAPAPATVPSPAAIAIPSEHYPSFIPNLSGFCLDASVRPCAIRIRIKPQLTAKQAGEDLNDNPTDKTVAWPREAYGSFKGNSLAVRCYTTYKTATVNALDDPTDKSNVWYQVVVPADHVKNTKYSQELKEKSPSLHRAQLDGHAAAIGYVAIVWLGQKTPAANIPYC